VGVEGIDDQFSVLLLPSVAAAILLVIALAAKTDAFATKRTLLPITPNNCRPLTAKDANMSEEERDAAMEKALKAMTAFSNKYVQNTNTYYCEDKSVPAVVIKGLAEHKVSLGTPLCPCRFYEDKEKEAKDGYWNCPCVPMRERHECHCMLFLTEDNDFSGTEQDISIDDVKKHCGFS
jgi:ferredoxin-thioredoxin reductase catalytic chain